MSGNSLGTLFRFTTFGESHGPAIGCVVDGVPSCLPLSEADLQPWLDRRKPGQNRFTTQRQEADQVRILSGVFDGRTTGTPIGLLIENTDQRSHDYSGVAETYRPGHADWVYDQKYGIRDYRGGGRSSARETAMRVAAGAVARVVLNHLVKGGVVLQGRMIQMGRHKVSKRRSRWDQVEQNPFWCPDPVMAEQWADYLDGIRKSGDSIGGVVEVVARNVPVGLGEPVCDRLDADLAKAMMSINAVKGVEIGDGFGVAALRGSENADPMVPKGKKGVRFLSNHAGGILGGISTGQDIVVRLAVKPTSSILIPQRSITRDGQPTEVITKGRHDPCVAIRAVPVAEAMMAVVLADHLLRQRAMVFTPKKG